MVKNKKYNDDDGGPGVDMMEMFINAPLTVDESVALFSGDDLLFEPGQLNKLSGHFFSVLFKVLKVV